MAMECPECGKQAYVLETRKARPRQGDPVTEYRRYVCQDWECNTIFLYRNTFVEYREGNVRAILRRLQRQGKNVSPDQSELELDD